jgi:RNA polymerase sigma-70 factor (ECF subfamily)
MVAGMVADTVQASETGGLGDLEQAAAVFAEVRPRLFGIAYRMLGTVTDAEDLVQEVWVRWQTYADRAKVTNPGAFLATTATRLAINATQTARVRRETYIGPWLPEPVDTSADPHLGAERGEALGFAVLLLLERLTPTERAAYVLREAFDYPYAQIAEIVQVSEPAVRQLVSRARKHVASERRTPVTGAEQRKLLATFVSAARSGDLAALEELLAADVVSYSDGGGAVRASRIPVVGALRVAKYHRAFAERFWAGVDVSWATTNGQASALLSNDGGVFAVLTVNASEQGIDQVLWMMNPAKITAAAGRTTDSA